MIGSRTKSRLIILSSLVVLLMSGCRDRLSSTYPKMKGFVTNQGFVQQNQVPSPTNLGPTAPWYGIATKFGSEYIVVIYPTTQKLYTVRLGVDGRLTMEQMMQMLIDKGYPQVANRVRLRGQTTMPDERKVLLFWVYTDDKGSASEYFDLQGNQMNVPLRSDNFLFQG